MKRPYIIILLLAVCINATFADNINQRVLTDSLRQFAARHAVLEARVRIKNIRQTPSTLRIETNPSLSGLPFTPALVNDMKDMVRQVTGTPQSVNIEIYTDGYEIEQLIGNYYLPPSQQRKSYTINDTEKPLVFNTTLPYNAPNGLQNKYIALWASHGRFYDPREARWRWQRATLLETVEDLLTSSFTMPYLVPMLENARAIVIQPRERDTQTKEVVMESSEAIGNDTKAWFIPEIPQDGNYAVYAWWEQGDEMSDDVTYTILHDGYKTPVKVNQRMGGHTWIYLGNFFFRKGHNEDNGVFISDMGTRHTDRLAGCRMKFGGGMGSIPRGIGDSATWQVSGLPRWMEAARYFLEYAGIPDSVYRQTRGKNEYIDDYSCRGRWLNYICGDSPAKPDTIGLRIPLNLGIAFHTDAGTCAGDTIVGTMAIFTAHNNDDRTTLPTGASRLTIRDYAQMVQTQVVEDIRRTYAPEWNRRELRNASYSETRNPEVPTIILETLSHQNLADMRYGHDPRFKFTVSRAVYKGILKYIANQYKYDYVVQPLPVNNFAIERQGEDSLKLTWQPTEDSLETTAKPTYYIVYQQTDEGEWSNGLKTTKPSIKLPFRKGHLYAFRVVAGNKGGISLPSETLAAYHHPNNERTALIINGFTRVSAPEYIHYRDSLDGFNPDYYGIPYGKDYALVGKQYEFRRELRWKSDDDPGYGATNQEYIQTLEAGNTFDYPVLHGKAIAKTGYTFVSQSLQYATKKGIKTTYAFTDLILGKQKETVLGTEKQLTDFKVIPHQLQQVLKQYTSYGGNLLVSGSYIGSDLNKNDAEREFMRQVLHCQLLSPNASKSGEIKTDLLDAATYKYFTKPNETRIGTEAPDALQPVGSNTNSIGIYSDTNLSAGVAFKGHYKCVALGFPIESLTSEKQVYRLMLSITNFFEH